MCEILVPDHLLVHQPMSALIILLKCLYILLEIACYLLLFPETVVIPLIKNHPCSEIHYRPVSGLRFRHKPNECVS